MYITFSEDNYFLALIKFMSTPSVLRFYRGLKTGNNSGLDLGFSPGRVSLGVRVLVFLDFI